MAAAAAFAFNTRKLRVASSGMPQVAAPNCRELSSFGHAAKQSQIQRQRTIRNSNSTATTTTPAATIAVAISYGQSHPQARTAAAAAAEGGKYVSHVVAYTMQSGRRGARGRLGLSLAKLSLVLPLTTRRQTATLPPLLLLLEMPP